MNSTTTQSYNTQSLTLDALCGQRYMHLRLRVHMITNVLFLCIALSVYLATCWIEFCFNWIAGNLFSTTAKPLWTNWKKRQNLQWPCTLLLFSCFSCTQTACCTRLADASHKSSFTFKNSWQRRRLRSSTRTRPSWWCSCRVVKCLQKIREIPRSPRVVLGRCWQKGY